MKSPNESCNTRLIAAGILAHRGHQDAIDYRSKILAALKARDNATKHITAPTVYVLRRPQN
jgi:hypothetical protein